MAGLTDEMRYSGQLISEDLTRRLRALDEHLAFLFAADRDDPEQVAAFWEAVVRRSEQEQEQEFESGTLAVTYRDEHVPGSSGRQRAAGRPRMIDPRDWTTI